MSQLAITHNPSVAKRRWIRWGALAAVALVPLAFAGLFVGALSQSDTALENIPAAIVNEDTLITTTADDGTETTVYAGRLLVSELTSGDTAGFDWKITNAEDAEKALADGEVYAILTVPSNFSKSILSVSGDNPVKADISIRTDDSHTYLGGSVAQVVGSTMTATFGKIITANYISGLFDGFGQLGDSLKTAADGAGELADGADKLADGVDSAASGASDLSTGVAKYTKGVDGLSGGLGTLASKTTQLPKLAAGVKQYTGGVSELSRNLAAVNAGLQQNPTSPQLLGALAAITSGLQQAAAGGPALSAGAAGLPALSSGIGQIASGAQQLSGGSPQLRSGVAGLASGLGELADGTSELASGTGELATGLSEGAEKVPSFDAATKKATSEIASDPVNLTVTTDNEVTEIGQAVATFFVPLGLWLGALAVFLVLRPATSRMLSSTAGNGRLVFAALVRASAVTAAQAALLVLLLHASLGVSWMLLPATLGFALLVALAFTAFHYLLTIAFGRAGLVVSLFLLAIQITSSGSIYPIEILAAPFQVISPFLPLTYAVSGMHGLISGGNAGAVVLASVVLLMFGIASVALSVFAIGRTRRAQSLGLIPVTA